MEYKVGQKVRIKGDADDFTDFLDGEIGTIVEVDENNVRVIFDSAVSSYDWYIWKSNIIEIVEDVE